MSKRVLLLVIAVVIATAGGVAARTDLNITSCHGASCSRDCSTQTLHTSTCYQDARTGLGISFNCLRNLSWTCFQGYAFSDDKCRHQISRNSLTCNSCYGNTYFECNAIEHWVTQWSDCQNCGNCSTATNLAIGKCVKNPQMPGTYVMMNALEPCGLTVIQNYYNNPSGVSLCSGSPFQVGIPSNFCASSNSDNSRDIICNGVDGAVAPKKLLNDGKVAGILA